MDFLWNEMKRVRMLGAKRVEYGVEILIENVASQFFVIRISGKDYFRE
jgi:hypothetical protein